MDTIPLLPKNYSMPSAILYAFFFVKELLLLIVLAMQVSSVCSFNCTLLSEWQCCSFMLCFLEGVSVVKCMFSFRQLLVFKLNASKSCLVLFLSFSFSLCTCAVQFMFVQYGHAERNSSMPSVTYYSFFFIMELFIVLAVYVQLNIAVRVAMLQLYAVFS